MVAERRVKPGDLVTDRLSHGAILVQNMYTARARNTRMNGSEVALVIRVGKDQQKRDVCDVLFKGEVWRTNTISLRVVSDG